MNFTVVIPARYASTRLPGKPLLELQGQAMIQHVWERAVASQAERVVIATDDERIQAHCESFGAAVMQTDSAHPSGTDRLAEVARRLELADDAIVVNVQGDEPLIPPAVIAQVADNLAQHERASIATLCEPLTEVAAFHDPNIVKVAMDERGYALYFSRAPIPWPRDPEDSEDAELAPDSAWRHLGIYAYRAGFLARFSAWEPAPLEQLEALEQLRALYHGEAIHVAPACEPVPGGIDTAEDLERLRALLGAQAGA